MKYFPIDMFSLQDAPVGGVPYYLFVPQKQNTFNATPLVLIHGISRNADQHMKAFLSYASQNGRILIAPVFDKIQGKQYQKVRSKHCRADLLLQAVLDNVRSKVGHNFRPFDLFGFSGGAQFSHRYALFYPQQVRRLAVASAGWYTFPDASQKFPYGVQGDDHRGRLINRQFKMFLAIPKLVLVGARDTKRDPALRRTERVDRLQGLNRLERAEVWADAVRVAAKDVGVAARVDFQVLPRSGHDFERCVYRGGLVEEVSCWLEGGEYQ